MRRQVILLGSVGVAACLILAGVGCSASQDSTLTRVSTIWQGDLDEYQQLALTYDRVRERGSEGPTRHYEQITLRVRPRKQLSLRRVLKTVELESGLASGQLRFGNVEARTDETRQKTWFVERDTGRIIGTLDRQTGKATGLDDPTPAWATPTGGVPLEAGGA